ncbi:TIGR02677 family protein [Pseudactinotalea sp. HY158]|uniref:TIGR02677 family protein n=1 Tax=Pseudactinotalea sp. HY158 TaxID=2654547 RepID=UPI001E4D02BF|nr:TIGR02677 family protein [Pseudactinotalea sp. HY158]
MTDQPTENATPAADGQGSYGPFAYLATPTGPLYRRVMRALMAQKERFTVHVRPEEVVEALRTDGGARVPEEAVAEALERLAQPSWGNVLAFPDSSRVTALEDFYRRRMLYQLSREGEAAERALAQYDAALGTRGALQSVALEDIVVLLTRLRDTALAHAAGEGVDTAVTHQALRSLRERFTELAENAVAFMGSMQRTIDLHDADVEAFLAYKEELIAYLERFIHDLLTRGAAISGLLAEIPEAGVAFLAATAAERESADAAPGEAGDAREAVRRTWLRQWSGLTEWFVSTPARESEAKLLRARARAAIPALLAVVRALHERAGGRTDRSEDFLTLATWFAALPTDGDRHRLWRSAFALTPVRHLSVTPATEEAWAAVELGNATPWEQAPPLEISPQLRRSGSYERRGKAVRVADRTEGKRLLADRARHESEQTAAARSRILTGGPRPLSSFGELDPEAFRLFLGLLGDALAAMGPAADTSQVHTSDGELTVTLTRIPGAATMVLTTPDGRLSGPDHLVDIASATLPGPEVEAPPEPVVGPADPVAGPAPGRGESHSPAPAEVYA